MKKSIKPTSMSRRSLLACFTTAGYFAFSEWSTAQTPPGTQHFGLDGGIEVRDYRIIPNPNAKRFIVEVHNTTDEPIDTPVIGVVLGHLPGNENFGIAVPGSDVLYPHSSGVLIGLAPHGLGDDGDWGTPDWVLCDKLKAIRSKELEALKLTLTYQLDVINDDNFHIQAFVTNHGNQGASFLISGDVFDKTGRACGTIYDSGPWWIPAELTDGFPIDIWRGRDYSGNPFHLVDSAFGITVHVTLQALPKYQPLICPAVMPWNR